MTRRSLVLSCLVLLCVTSLSAQLPQTPAEVNTWLTGRIKPLVPRAVNPLPAQKDVQLSALEWSSLGATSCDLHLGTASSPPLLAADVACGSYVVALPAGTKHYWKVKAKNVAGSVTSPTWSFTTAAPVPERPQFDLTGIVMDGAARPIGGATVTCVGDVPPACTTRTTDGSGFVHVPVYGSTSFKVEAPGYLPREFIGQPPWPVADTDACRANPGPCSRRWHLEKEPPPPIVKRTGVVRLEGNSLVDDQGVWFADGVTLMPALALVRDFPAVAEANCLLSQQGITVGRFLAVVGGDEFAAGSSRADPWARLKADPRDPAWAAQLAATTDYFYDRCGIRSAWTLFGGTAFAPTVADQNRVVSTWVEVMRPRLHKVAWVEIANEMWQNGFGGDEGIGRARGLASALCALLPPKFPIAISTSFATANDGEPEPEMGQMFANHCANLYTPHFSRRADTVDGPHRIIRQPWEWSPVYSLAAAVNNEFSGPGSSVRVERNTSRIVAGWITTKIARLTGYHLHTDAGVWAGQIHSAFLGGHEDGLRGAFSTIQSEPGAADALDAMAKLRAVLPADMHTWQRTRHGFANHPFAASFQQVGNTFTQIWPDGHTGHGVVRAYCAIRGNDFVCLLSGIRDRIDLRMTHNLRAKLYACGTGAEVGAITDVSGAYTVRQSVDTDVVVIGKYD